jgi:hypothetical protein
LAFFDGLAPSNFCGPLDLDRFMVIFTER